jgi:hypothetical protein
MGRLQVRHDVNVNRPDAEDGGVFEIGSYLAPRVPSIVGLIGFVSTAVGATRSRRRWRDA